MPNGRISTFLVEKDTIKIALSVKDVRNGLSICFPGHFEFESCETSFDTIKDEDNAFRKGQQIKWFSHISQSSWLRGDIHSLETTLLSNYSQQTYLRRPLNFEENVSLCY